MMTGQPTLVRRLVLVSLIYSALARCVVAAEPAAPALGGRVLKHRVEIVTPPPAESGKEALDMELSRRKDSLLDEGVAISRAEWATAVDVLKEQMAGSEILRLVEAVAHAPAGKPGKEKSAPDEPPLVLQARFGASGQTRLVLLRLSKRGHGYLIASAKASGLMMDAAVRGALTQIEKELVLHAWRCRVLDADGDKLIIGRGHFDGLRRGQVLTGYNLSPKGREAAGQSDEFVLMKFGTRAGSYEIDEAGQDFSRLKPVGQSLALAAGDLLEIPAVYLRDTNDVTRGTRIWDRLYPEKKQP